MRLDGSTKVDERQGMVDEFTEDEGIQVFLLSTRAGGMG
jgi:SWI/SNF-related matrix-associated actin-dependent regulator 1 of chromatin subfamily A